MTCFLLVQTYYPTFLESSSDFAKIGTRFTPTLKQSVCKFPYARMTANSSASSGTKSIPNSSYIFASCSEPNALQYVLILPSKLAPMTTQPTIRIYKASFVTISTWMTFLFPPIPPSKPFKSFMIPELSYRAENSIWLNWSPPVMKSCPPFLPSITPCQPRSLTMHPKCRKFSDWSGICPLMNCNSNLISWKAN